MVGMWFTFSEAKALTCAVVGMWGPRHRSTSGPQRYTVMVLSSGSSLMISTCEAQSQIGRYVKI